MQSLQVRNNRIHEFDILRVWAIMMVFLSHSTIYPSGGLGAMTFFVLGGFCTTLGYRSKVCSSNFSYKDYLSNRLIKLLPLHWITLAVVLCSMLIRHNGISFRQLTSNFFLLQSWVQDRSYYFSFNAVAWYLSTLMLFVVVFPAIIYLLEQMNRKQRFITCVGLLVGYVIILFAIPSSSYHAIMYICPAVRLFDSVIGVLLAYLYDEVRTNEKWLQYGKSWLSVVVVVVVVVVGLMIVVNLVVNKQLQCVSGLYWLPVSVVILTMALQHAADNKNLLLTLLYKPQVKRLLAGTFSFYLWHQLVLRLLMVYFSIDNPYYLTFIGLALSVIITELSYELVEIRLTKWLCAKYNNWQKI